MICGGRVPTCCPRNGGCGDTPPLTCAHNYVAHTVALFAIKQPILQGSISCSLKTMLMVLVEVLALHQGRIQDFEREGANTMCLLSWGAMSSIRQHGGRYTLSAG